MSEVRRRGKTLEVQALSNCNGNGAVKVSRYENETSDAPDSNQLRVHDSNDQFDSPEEPGAHASQMHAWRKPIIYLTAITILGFSINVAVTRQAALKTNLATDLQVWTVLKEFKDACEAQIARGTEIAEECKEILSRPFPAEPSENAIFGWLRAGSGPSGDAGLLIGAILALARELLSLFNAVSSWDFRQLYKYGFLDVVSGFVSSASVLLQNGLQKFESKDTVFRDFTLSRDTIFRLLCLLWLNIASWAQKVCFSWQIALCTRWMGLDPEPAAALIVGIWAVVFARVVV